MANEYRVAILGKTGTGKSSLGNSLLGVDTFTSKLSLSSVSKECELGEARTPIGKLMVVDTPGLFDTVTGNKATVREMKKCIDLLAPGPHIFIVALDVGRFSRDDTESVAILQRILGYDNMHHIVVVFTKKDQLEDNNMTVREFIGDAPRSLKNLLDNVHGRYEFICNKKRGTHQQDVENVLSLIKKTVRQNGGKYFTRTMLEDGINKECPCTII